VGVTFSSPHSFHSGAGSQRPGAVKGARFLARRSATLDGEDRCETITEGRKEPLSNSAYPLQSPNSHKYRIRFWTTRSKRRIGILSTSKACHPLTQPDPFFIYACDRFVEPSFPNAGVALDLACGLGRHALWLAERNWRVCGVDLSDVAIGKAGN
jgi:hypothetical protein